jgi:hypothetical protein
MPDGIRWVGLDVQSAGINRHGEGDGRALHRRSSDPRWPRVMVRRDKPSQRREWKSPTLKE